jgi:hypothetical protein
MYEGVRFNFFAYLRFLFLRFLFDLFLRFLFLLDFPLRPPACPAGAVAGALGLGGPMGFTCENADLFAAVDGAWVGGASVLRGLECTVPILT